MSHTSDLYLPGTVQQTGDGVRFVYDGVELPLSGIEDIPAGLTGQSCTLGLAVDVARVEPAEKTDVPGVAVDDGTVTIVGKKHRVGYFFGRSRQATYNNVTVRPGLWPVQSDEKLRAWAEPLDAVDGDPDRVRIVADQLTVAEVLAGEDDPYAEEVRGLHFEFRPDSEAFQLRVGETQVWPRTGWYDGGERALQMLGEALRAELGGPDPELTDHQFHHPGIELKVIDGFARLRVGSSDRAVGPWPVAGLRLELADLVRVWLRDTQWFLTTRTSEGLARVHRDVAELADIDDEDLAHERPLSDADAFTLAELFDVVTARGDWEQDALAVVRDRTTRDTADEVGAFLVDADLSDDEARVLVEELGAVGGLAAVRHLVQFAAATPGLRDDTVDAITENPRVTVAAALAVDWLDDPAVDPALRTLADAADDEPDWAPDGTVDPAGTDAVVDALLTEARTADDRWRRELAAYALGAVTPTADDPDGDDSGDDTDGPVDEAWLDALLEAMVEEQDEAVRTRLLGSAQHWAGELQAHAEAHALAVCDDRKRRRELRESSADGTAPAFLLSWLDVDDPTRWFEDDDRARWRAALRSAPAFRADPPYEAVIDALVRTAEFGDSDWATTWTDGLDALTDLLADETTPRPPVEPLLALCESDTRSRNVALETLVALAVDYDGGDLFGVDPERVHRTVYRTQQGTLKEELNWMADLTALTFEAFEPASIDDLPAPKLQRSIVLKVTKRIGERARPALEQYATEREGEMVEMCESLLAQLDEQA